MKFSVGFEVCFFAVPKIGDSVRRKLVGWCMVERQCCSPVRRTPCTTFRGQAVTFLVACGCIFSYFQLNLLALKCLSDQISLCFLWCMYVCVERVILIEHRT